MNEKHTRNESILQKPIKRAKYPGCHLLNILGTILEVDHSIP